MFNILLIEDDEIDVITVQRSLKKNSFSNRLYVAANGLEALAFLREYNRQSLGSLSEHLLILLDLHMPKMNGLEFLTHLQSDLNLKKLSVIVLITFEEERHRMDKSHPYIAGYLEKPFTFSKLTQLMKTFNQKKCLSPIP